MDGLLFVYLLFQEFIFQFSDFLSFWSTKPMASGFASFFSRDKVNIRLLIYDFIM